MPVLSSYLLANEVFLHLTLLYVCSLFGPFKLQVWPALCARVRYLGTTIYNNFASLYCPYNDRQPYAVRPRPRPIAVGSSLT